MTEKEFQEKHEFNDETMSKIKAVCKLYKAKVTKIAEGRKDGDCKYDKWAF